LIDFEICSSLFWLRLMRRPLKLLLAACALLLLARTGEAQSPLTGPSSYYQMPPTNQRHLSPAEEPAANTRPPLKLAPRSGEHRSGLAKPAVPSPSGALGTVAGSLGIVLGLFFVLVWCSRRFSPAGQTQLPKEAVEILGRASFSSKQQLQLLRVGNKLLLVAHSPAGIETLTEITAAAEVEHLTALCRRGQSGSSSAAFRQVLDQLAAEPAPGGFVGDARRQNRGAR
jgi:flagellar biogenesis protein FliO